MILEVYGLFSFFFFFNRKIPLIRRNSSNDLCILEMKIPSPIVKLEKNQNKTCHELLHVGPDPSWIQK